MNEANNQVAYSVGAADYSDGGRVRQLVSEACAGLGLNRDDPFRDMIGPGQTALLKPNWVLDHHPGGLPLESLVTHTSVIEAVMGLLATAMKGRGTIIIGDAPIQKCNFGRLLRDTGVAQMVDNFRALHPDLTVVIEDWRLTIMDDRGSGSLGTQHGSDDFGRIPVGTHSIIDVGEDSFLEDISDYASRFRVTCYQPSLMKAHHQHGVHRYLVTNRIDEVHLCINLPKLKTHMKAGLTGALKNSVGINGHKEYLPHHITGPHVAGGDNYLVANRLWRYYEDTYDSHWEQYPTSTSWQKRVGAMKVRMAWLASQAPNVARISAGSWSGNETVWRTALDLSHVWYFRGAERRNILTIVDGIVSGEGNGPLRPVPVDMGTIIAGYNPAVVDAAIARMIGYNLSRVPTVYHGLFHTRSRFAIKKISEIQVVDSSGGKLRRLSYDQIPVRGFRKPDHWNHASLGPDAL